MGNLLGSTNMEVFKFILVVFGSCSKIWTPCKWASLGSCMYISVPTGRRIMCWQVRSCRGNGLTSHPNCTSLTCFILSMHEDYPYFPQIVEKMNKEKKVKVGKGNRNSK